MTDTTALKNRIRAAIKANDNQEITGPVLQQALLDIVDELNGATETEASQRQNGDSTLQQGINTERQARIDANNALSQRITDETQRAQGVEQNLQQAVRNLRDAGYAFGGIAVTGTNPGVPTGNCFYIVRGAGTYTHFKNADNEPIVLSTDGIYVLTYESVENNYWEYNLIVGIDGEPANSENLIKSKAIKKIFPGGAPNTFSVGDESGYAILSLLSYLCTDAQGNIKTKSFDSSQLKVIADEDDTFRIEDIGRNAIMLLQNYLKVDKDGNISTKAFSSAKRKETLIIVDANGNGDYTTIEDALNNANDSVAHHVNILIKEGVYYPSPKVSNVAPYQENNRNISLIGENRNKCIIRNDIGFYDYVIGTDCTPLRLNGNVTIENLTILSYSTLYRQYYGTPGFVTERANRNSSYCIHRDGDSNEGDEFVIKDCIMINDHFTCVGFGLKKNVTLRIEDCYCQSEENEDDSAESLYGVLYGHFDSNKKGLNQNLEVIRCQLVNVSSYQAINLMDAKASDATPQDTFANLKFISNTVDTTNNANAFVTHNTIEGFYAISKLSFGNRCEAMNYNV